MSSKRTKKILLAVGSALGFCLGTAAFAVSGIGGVAENVTGNLGNVAKLITAGSYIAGMGFGVGAIVKFKAHKDNPTQIPIGMPIALLFVAAALLFIPSVFKTSGGTMFGGSGMVAGVSGVTGFGATKATDNK
jgi:intracellular multiplication protein IcmD